MSTINRARASGVGVVIYSMVVGVTTVRAWPTNDPRGLGQEAQVTRKEAYSEGQKMNSERTVGISSVGRDPQVL